MRFSLLATFAVLAAVAAAAASQLRGERGDKAQSVLQAADAADAADKSSGKAADMPPGSWGGSVPHIATPTPTPTTPLELPTSGHGGDDCNGRCSPACGPTKACQYVISPPPRGCQCALYCPPRSSNKECMGSISIPG